MALIQPAMAAPNRRSDPKLTREARKHKAAGIEQLKRRHLGRAIEELQIAYSLSPNDTDVIYQLARAYNARKEYPQALYYYRLYREKDPSGARRRRVGAIIEAIVALQTPAPDAEQTADSTASSEPAETPVDSGSPTRPSDPSSKIEGRRPAASATETTAPREGATEPSSSTTSSTETDGEVGLSSSVDIDEGDEGPGSGKRLAGLATTALGVAAIGAGLYYAYTADQTASKWDGDSNLHLEGTDARRNGIILAGAGGAAVATGVIVYVLGRLEGSASRHVAVVPMSGGGALSFRSEF